MRYPRLAGALVAFLCLTTAACDDAEEPAADPDRIVLNPPAEGSGHTHAPGESDGAPVGDGTTAGAGGYRLTDVRLPAQTGQPAAMSFTIVGPDGQPVTDYVEQQTKLMHLYVVRDDLAIYRHLHPTLSRSGRWTVPVDVGAPGDYRVIADFLPDGAERPVVLGASATVPGAWTPVASEPPTDDGTVRVEVDGAGTVGDDGRLHLVVTTTDDEPVTLGSYLGTTAHVSGFRSARRPADRTFVHVHPYGAAETTADGTRLTFHTAFAEAGDYRFFVQVRVDGILHTVPVTCRVR